MNPAMNDSLTQLGIELPQAMLAALRHYLDALLEANTRFNLTAVSEPAQAWERHIVDSLTLLPFIEELPEGSLLVDVGSGGGLPGVPLAITRPDLRVTLIESTQKKAAFLASLALPNVTVLPLRAEAVGHDPAHRERYDVATCRAVGAMATLLEYTMPLLRVGGHLLAMKGPSVETELPDAGDAMDALGCGELQVYDAYPEAMERRTVVVRVEKARVTPMKYPRPGGAPKGQPL